MYGDGPWGVPGYTEVRELGSGAGGRVVLARRDYDGVDVAIKYLSDELRSDVSFVARFRHEARLLATVQSAYHARLYDYVETGQGAAIVMELIDGVSLRELIRAEGPTGPEAALAVLKSSLRGLAAAHSIGVVHRDLKPENVMVLRDGTSKLVDFGIAVRVGEEANAAGTPPYMAPELWSGAPAGPATDMYAATVAFYECLTGHRPFMAQDIAPLVRQHQSTAPPLEQVPQPLRGLVERGLAKHAADRPPSAQAYLAALEEIAAVSYGPDWEERGRHRLAALADAHAPVYAAAPQEDPDVESTVSFAQTHYPEQRPQQQKPQKRLLGKLPVKFAIAGAALVAVLVSAVVFMISSQPEAVLQAQTTEVTPTSAEPGTPDPVESVPEETDLPEETDEPVEEESPTVSETPTPTPTPAVTRRPVRPTVRPARTPTATPTRTRQRRPIRTRTPVHSPTATRTQDEEPDPEITGDVDPPRADKPDPTPTRPTQPAPTFTPPREPDPPTERPTPTGGTSPESPPTGGTSPESPPTAGTSPESPPPAETPARSGTPR
ncbi:protein kinase [Nonomuraea sp. NPDC052634]|uniref:serine/threonine-protein kinase n=1 Tax=Nonomuraea sp. NPDC052634 TaxID=3155813 RepID=UPI003413D2BA